MSDNINIHEIILQLVKTDFAFKESDLSKLLPIDNVYPGFGLYSGTHKIIFDPPEEYDKEPYEIEVNVDDDEERVNKLTQLNDDIREYNEWASEQNRLRDEEIIKKEIPENSDKLIPTPIAVESKWFTPMEEYQMWQFITSKASPKKFRESYMEDLMTIVNHEALYKLKEILDSRIFVIRFNKSLFNYVREKVNEAKKYDTWNEENIWYEPNTEFVRWFQMNGLEISAQNDLEYQGDLEILSDNMPFTSDMEDKEKELERLRKENEGINNQLRISHEMVKKLTLRTKFKLSTLSDDEIQHIVDDTRKRNGKINYANTGRHFGVDAKTVKDEIIRRNMTWLENSPD